MNELTRQDLIKILNCIELYLKFSDFKQLKKEIIRIKNKKVVLNDFNKKIIENLLEINFEKEFKQDIFFVYKYILNYLTLDTAKSKILALFPEYDIFQGEDI